MINYWKPRPRTNGSLHVLIASWRLAAVLVIFYVTKIVNEPDGLLSNRLQELQVNMPDKKDQEANQAAMQDEPLPQMDHGNIRGLVQSSSNDDPEDYYVPTSCEETLNDQLLDGRKTPHGTDQENMHARQMKYRDAYAKILHDTTQGRGETRVLDVGNTGFFTLLAAYVPNVVVDAFEPNPENRLRFCELSRFKNGDITSRTGSQVNLYPFAVGQRQEEEYLSFQEASSHGQGNLIKLKPGEKVAQSQNMMRVIKLDEFARARGWFDDPMDASSGASGSDIAILKVGVEGMVNAVIKGAATLIEAKIIRNILMKVTAQDNMPQNEEDDLKQALQIIVQAGYTLYRVGGSTGPSQGFEDAPANPDALPDAIIRRTREEKAFQLNLWWTLDVEQVYPDPMSVSITSD